MKKVVLAILDGVGHREETHGNAFLQSNKPNFDYLYERYPNSLLNASGKHVGLPDDQMGNSEVGHLNIGAGRIIYQPLQLINKEIETETFYENENILSVVNYTKEKNSKLHVFGLISDGGVHSNIEHFFAVLELAKRKKVNDVYFHLVTDGRDTSYNSSYSYIKKLEEKIVEKNIGKISTICGRYYSMDRDTNYERTKRAYDLMINMIGNKYDCSKDCIEDNYNKEITDEFIEPSIIDESGKIEENDGIIVLNFRPDRLTQILSSITNDNFNNFENKKDQNIKVVTMMPVSEKVISKPAFKLKEIENTLGEHLANLNKRQLRIAETEKYAHVTYFFDGGKEKELISCDRVLISSPKVATYDMQPEMSCYEVTDKLLEIMKNYDVIILNYANGDMVGHTGNIEAAKKAVEAVDYNLGRLYEKCKEEKFTLLITADHGNCEYMLDDDNNMITAHTRNKVYFIVCDEAYTLSDGKLGDIAPTILKIMDIEKPHEMDGEVLIKNAI